MLIQKIKAPFPDKFQPLFTPKRYKVYYGGRGGAKSWAFSRALLLLGAKQQLRIFCCREIQKTIRDSVHKLLKDQIPLLGLSHFYKPTDETIRGANGTEFIFAGLHNNTQLKSMEGVDICWVEEAHLVSKTSWEILIPTIRKEGSEIWISFNPELEDDETYKRFVLNPPSESIVVKVNWRDNPFITQTLLQEKDDLKAKDEDAYNTVWEGNCRLVLEGSIFSKQLKAAYADNRITRVPYDPSAPVDTYWDLGWADFTSIWFIQPMPLEFRVIRFYQNHLQDLDHYLSYIQSLNYSLRELYLPHDSKSASLAAGGRSIISIIRGKGFSCRSVERVKDKIQGINAARTVFPQCYFDEKNCADGLLALKRYRFEYDEDTGKYSDKPAHDWASHAADAFQQFGISARVAPTVRQIEESKNKKPWDIWAVLED